MKKKITKEVEVTAEFCDICEKEITDQPWNKTRIEIVQHIFKTSDFNAHEICINQVTRAAFQKYFQK